MFKIFRTATGSAQTGTEYFRPGYTAYEAKDVLVTENYVEDVARRPVNVKGALD